MHYLLIPPQCFVITLPVLGSFHLTSDLLHPLVGIRGGWARLQVTTSRVCGGAAECHLAVATTGFSFASGTHEHVATTATDVLETWPRDGARGWRKQRGRRIMCAHRLQLEVSNQESAGYDILLEQQTRITVARSRGKLDRKVGSRQPHMEKVKIPSLLHQRNHGSTCPASSISWASPR